MAEVIYCDICGEIIKPNDKSFVLAIDAKNKNMQRGMNPQNFFQQYNQRLEQIEVQEICVKCKKVYDYIFKTIRLDELKRIRKEVKEMYAITEKLAKPKEEE